MQSFGDYLHKHVGTNWVLARRTSGIVARYGENVVCLSQKRYDELAESYARETLRDARGGLAYPLIVDKLLAALKGIQQRERDGESTSNREWQDIDTLIETIEGLKT